MVNGFGAVVTALATAIFLISKFTQGAWVVVVAVPSFVFLFRRINAYYKHAGLELGWVHRSESQPANQPL